MLHHNVHFKKVATIFAISCEKTAGSITGAS